MRVHLDAEGNEVMILAAVTPGALSRCFLLKQRAYNVVLCDRSFFSTRVFTEL